MWLSKTFFYFSYGDLIGCYLSFSFIASYVIYPAFAFGGGCRIFNENEQKDILSLIKILKEKPMNSLFLPPTIAIPILESDDIKLDYLVLVGAKLKELSKKERNTQQIFDATSAGVFKQDFMTLLDGGNIGFDDTFLKTSASHIK